VRYGVAVLAVALVCCAVIVTLDTMKRARLIGC
jgi:hypothetical protein